LENLQGAASKFETRCKPSTIAADVEFDAGHARTSLPAHVIHGHHVAPDRQEHALCVHLSSSVSPSLLFGGNTILRRLSHTAVSSMGSDGLQIQTGA